MGRGERDRAVRAVTVADLTETPREDVRMTLHEGAEEAHD